MEQEERAADTIEVCIGPDCSVSGGPAALWEIEELSLESQCRYRVVPGGCRELCTLGPNVHFDGLHFGKVKSPEDCEELAKKIGIKDDDSHDKVTSRVGVMFTKKANRARWQMLRNVTTQSNRSGRKKATWRKELDSVHSAELTAAGMCGVSAEELRQRAVRRRDRLELMIDSL